MEAVGTESSRQFLDLCTKFRAFHSSETNLNLHLATTPLAVWAAIAAINKVLGGNSAPAVGVIAAYLITLSGEVSAAVFLPTAVCVTAIMIFSVYGARMSWTLLAILFCVGYFGQDLAHWGTGEATLQSSYQQDDDFWIQLLEHTYYLIPLVFDARLPAEDMRRTQQPFLDTATVGENRVRYVAITIGMIISVLWTVFVDTPMKKVVQQRKIL